MSNERNANRDKMTSTSFNVGLNDTARLSSRVLRPPGGGHTDIFGSEPEPPRTTGRRAAPQASLVTGQGDEPKSTNGTDAPAANGQASTPEAPAPVPKAESPAKIESPPKVDSPSKAEPEQARMEAPKRVRVPPGGFSSGLW